MPAPGAQKGRKRPQSIKASSSSRIGGLTPWLLWDTSAIISAFSHVSLENLMGGGAW